jgi:GxxExxY protein
MEGMEESTDRSDQALTEAIIGSAIEVHRSLGPGLLESCYESCLVHELHSRGIEFQRQIEIGVAYKGQSIDCGFRIDLLVENKVIIEIKAVDSLNSVQAFQEFVWVPIRCVIRQGGTWPLPPWNPPYPPEGLGRTSRGRSRQRPRALPGERGFGGRP